MDGWYRLVGRSAPTPVGMATLREASPTSRDGPAVSRSQLTASPTNPGVKWE